MHVSIHKGPLSGNQTTAIAHKPNYHFCTQKMWCMNQTVKM